MLEFFRSAKVQLDLVKWPSRQETLRLTTIVVVVSLLVGLYVGGLDLLFTNLLTKLVTR